MKDIIIRHDGFKVFPSFIEDVVMQDPAVLECKAVGVQDTNFVQGELPYVYIVLNKNVLFNTEIEDRINALCELQLQEYSLPIGFKFIDEMPQTNIGKIDIKTLKDDANKELSIKNLVKKD